MVEETFVFEPASGSARKYVLRRASVADKMRFHSEVRRAGGRQWGMVEILEAVRDGVRQILPEGDEDRLDYEGLIQAQLDKFDLFRHAVDDDERGRLLVDAFDIPPLLEDLSATVERHYPRLAGMNADNLAYPGVAGAVACSMFLVEWEGVNAPLVRRLGKLSDESLNAIPADDITAIGYRVQAEMAASENEKKASGASSSSRSQGDGSKAVSTSAPDTKATSGRSTAGKPESPD